MRIVHLADTHIKNLKYHEDYKQMFEKLFALIREQNPDIIIHSGDIAHTKNQITPEWVELASKFIDGLSEIAPLKIILGNHDNNVRNMGRVDAISPIVQILKKDNITLHKGHALESYGNLDLHYVSIFDDNNLPTIDPDNINVLIYHGAVEGCETETGFVLDHSDIDSDIVQQYDYALLGDIHKRQVVLHDERKQYCGSTIQQNFGESMHKGFLVWDIREKNNYDVKFIEVPNDFPFINIVYEEKKGKIKDIPKNSYVRITHKESVTDEQIQSFIADIQVYCQPRSIVFSKNYNITKKNTSNEPESAIENDLRNYKTQEKLIRSFLKEYEINEDLYQKILEVNQETDRQISLEDDNNRGVIWKINKLSWDNLFMYGSGNILDFDDYNGIIGVLGANYTGKSSLFEVLLFTIFNSITKKNKKNIFIINDQSEYGKGVAELEAKGQKFIIERTIERYFKTTKGTKIPEAKIDVDFYTFDEDGNKISLCGDSRDATDKNIRSIFGTRDDFLLTSMLPQNDSVNFIKEGAIRRKEILSGFLDLDIFEKKFVIAKKKLDYHKNILSEYNAQDYNAILTQELSNIYDIDLGIASALQEIERVKQDNDNNNKMVEMLLAKIPGDLYVIQNTKNSIVDLENNITKYESEIEKAKSQILSLKHDNDNMTLNNNSVDLKYHEDLLTEFDKRETYRREHLRKIEKARNDLSSIADSRQVLQSIPCGDKYRDCKFIKDAFEKIDKESYAKEVLNVLLNQLKILDDWLLGHDYNLSKSVVDKFKGNERLLESNKKQIGNLENLLAHYNETLQSSNLLYNEQKTLLVKLESSIDESVISGAQSEMALHKQQISSNKNILSSLEEKLRKLYKDKGACENNIEKIKDLIDRKKEVIETYNVYDLYCKCMHTNGIRYQLIKKYLPIINNEISSIMHGIMDFNIKIEDSVDKMEILIEKDNEPDRIIEMGSGSENAIATLVIRLALISISSLPKTNMLILDEPGTSLDDKNLQNFIAFLNVIKSSFEKVFIISHLDALKECVDNQIYINKQGKFANI